jgi:hypothetical protein
MRHISFPRIIATLMFAISLGCANARLDSHTKGFPHGEAHYSGLLSEYDNHGSKGLPSRDFMLSVGHECYGFMEDARRIIEKGLASGYYHDEESLPQKAFETWVGNTEETQQKISHLLVAHPWARNLSVGLASCSSQSYELGECASFKEIIWRLSGHACQVSVMPDIYQFAHSSVWHADYLLGAGEGVLFTAVEPEKESNRCRISFVRPIQHKQGQFVLVGLQVGVTYVASNKSLSTDATLPAVAPPVVTFKVKSQ